MLNLNCALYESMSRLYADKKNQCYPRGQVSEQPIHFIPPNIDEEFLQTAEGKIVDQAVGWLVESDTLHEKTKETFYERFQTKGGLGGLVTCVGQAYTWFLETRIKKSSLKEQRTTALFLQLAPHLENELMKAEKTLTQKLQPLREKKESRQRKLLQKQGDRKEKLQRKIADSVSNISAAEKKIDLGKQHLQRLKISSIETFIAPCNETLVLQKKSKEEVAKLVQLKAEELFSKYPISNIFTMIDFVDEVTQEPTLHSRLIQPDRLALYDSWCGEVKYSSKEDLLKDLVHHTEQFNLISINFQVIVKK